MMYAIGSNHWPGLSKLIEEAGEVLQVAGEIQGLGTSHESPNRHWDGSELRERLIEELADLTAAIIFVRHHCKLDAEQWRQRTEEKLKLFNEWHKP